METGLSHSGAGCETRWRRIARDIGLGCFGWQASPIKSWAVLDFRRLDRETEVWKRVHPLRCDYR